jgi:phosphohistidine phosphatase SixA
VLLVRHAQAGDRLAWAGPDAARPLDGRGRRQAEALVAQLATYDVGRIVSSPAARCVQTVEPLARARGLTVETDDALAVDRQSHDGAALVESLAADVVVCAHGGLEHEVVEDPPRWRKASTIVLGPDLRVLEVLPPPDRSGRGGEALG